MSKNTFIAEVTFKKQYKSADPLYKNLKIIKFQDLLQLSNCLFMCQLEQNKTIAATFPGFVYTKEKHNYNTKSVRKPLRYPSLPNLHLWDAIMQIPMH